jgi:hypothetical protein
MKKFLKVFIIVLLVVAVVAGTCVFFFKRMEKRNNTTESLAGMFAGEANKKFNEDLSFINSIVKAGGTDNRIELIVETNKNLDSILLSLITFHIGNDFKINDKEISKAVDSLNHARSVMNSMMVEYNIKKDSEFFNRQLGINDFYKQSCSYFVNYANLIKLINDDLNVNRMADAKYNIYDVYANVVIQTFSSTNASSVQNAPVVITNSANINKINSYFKQNDSFFKTSNVFDSNVSNFNRYYMNCNKSLFASEFANNVENVTTENQSTNEKIATYYFKLIF